MEIIFIFITGTIRNEKSKRFVEERFS